MSGGTPVFVVLMMLAMMPAFPTQAWADETDNFTCRDRPLADSLAVLDGWVNARIREAVERANRRGGCDTACLFRELQNRVGENDRHPLTWIPHARLARWAERQPDVDRCHLGFRESIYGARPYNQPWLYPFTGRIIFLADSIRLSGRVVGIDKINHFIREGLAHWRARDRTGGDIASVMAQELGSPRRRSHLTEYGLKGMSLTGVFAYADMAASYSGFRFWNDALSAGRPESFVARDPASGVYAQQRPFSFAAYVNDAWDESINCSEFDPALAKQVAAARRTRSSGCRVTDCPRLAELPQAGLYVNPICRAFSTRRSSTPHPRASANTVGGPVTLTETQPPLRARPSR